MGKPVAWLWLLSFCAGCAAFPVASPAPPVAPPTEIQLAADCLEKGDDAAALPHLTRYVETHPEHATVRAHLAELQLKLGRAAEAQREFDRYVQDAQPLGGEAARHLLHAHTRLAELAAATGDDYREHLNRGIGLLLLARQLLAKPAVEGEPDPEKLLFKAAEELKLAAEKNPAAVRPQWYLYETWSELGQQLPARRNLRRAHARAEFSDLTPAERAALTLAWAESNSRSSPGLSLSR